MITPAGQLGTEGSEATWPHLVQLGGSTWIQPDLQNSGPDSVYPLLCLQEALALVFLQSSVED